MASVAQPEEIAVHGRVEPGFEAVRDTFAENLAGSELGASFAVAREGRLVVDLWGGWADAARTRPWQRDTLANVWSTTKGVAALCCAMLVDRGALDYDAPVARYWPEFGVRGRERLSVAQLLSHQAGLSGPRQPVSWLDYCDADAINALLIEQESLFEPGTASGYHAVTFGPLVGELVRRACGRSLGAFLRDEVAGPLGADFHVGLPESEDHRCAEMVVPPAREQRREWESEVQRCALANPAEGHDVVNGRAWRAAEIPSVNGQASASGLATIYGVLAAGGSLGGCRLLSRRTLARAVSCQIENTDLVIPVPFQWACGWIRNFLKVIYGPNPEAFGHTGLGGSFGYADPAARVGVGYAMNRMASNLLGDPRGIRLVRALHACI